jgi:predicted transcriptional regulator
MASKTLNIRLDEATEAHLEALTKGRKGARSEVVRDAVASARQAATEKDFAPLTERLMRAVLANQEALLKLGSEIQQVAGQVTEARKHQADRFDQVIAFVRESEKGFGRVMDDLKAVNQNALLSAIYLMGLTATHPKKDEIEAFVRRQGGA